MKKLQFTNGHVRQALRNEGVVVESHTADCRLCRLDKSIPGGRLVGWDHDCVADGDFDRATCIANEHLGRISNWLVEKRVANSDHWDVVAKARTQSEAIEAAKNVLGGASTGVRIGTRDSDHRKVIVGV